MNEQFKDQTARALARRRGDESPEGLAEARECVEEAALIIKGLAGKLPEEPVLSFGWRLRPKQTTPVIDIPPLRASHG